MFGLPYRVVLAIAAIAIVGGLAWFYGHSQKQIGELEANLERATADRIALETSTNSVTKALEQSTRELQRLKEGRNDAKDRLHRVADPTGCLDTVFPSPYADELRRAYGGNDRAP